MSLFSNSRWLLAYVAVALAFAALIGTPSAASASATYNRVINLAGKQRMLTQKMSKEFLLVVYGFEASKNRKNLSRTAALFETALDALLEGDAQLGLPSPPSKKIAAQLERVERLWLSFLPLLAKVAEGSTVTTQEVQEVASRNISLLRAMNKAVNMYEAL